MSPSKEQNGNQLPNKVSYDIPEKGSLGLLAAGYRGLQLWRKKILKIDPNESRLVGPVINGKILPINAPKNEK